MVPGLCRWLCSAQTRLRAAPQQFGATAIGTLTWRITFSVGGGCLASICYAATPPGVQLSARLAPLQHRLGPELLTAALHRNPSGPCASPLRRAVGGGAAPATHGLPATPGGLSAALGHWMAWSLGSQAFSKSARAWAGARPDRSVSDLGAATLRPRSKRQLWQAGVGTRQDQLTQDEVASGDKVKGCEGPSHHPRLMPKALTVPVHHSIHPLPPAHVRRTGADPAAPHPIAYFPSVPWAPRGSRPTSQ